MSQLLSQFSGICSGFAIEVTLYQNWSLAFILIIWSFIEQEKEY